MAKDWEITGRLGELQLAWLREHYPEEVLAEALATLPKKGFPLNVAKKLQWERGGPAMPLAAELLAADPQSQQRASIAAAEALAKLRAKGFLR